MKKINRLNIRFSLDITVYIYIHIDPVNWAFFSKCFDLVSDSDHPDPGSPAMHNLANIFFKLG